MKRSVLLLLAIMLLPACARGELNEQKSTIGYVYPSGARQGDTVQIVVGGQNLRGSLGLELSVPGAVATSFLRFNPLSVAQQRELRERTKEILRSRLPADKQAELKAKDAQAGVMPPERVDLPDHPLLRDLDKKSADEMRQLNEFFNLNARQQVNRAIQEQIFMELKIPAGTPPGDYEFRLRTQLGLTNPLIFQVGAVPEVREDEPYGYDPRTPTPLQTVKLPCLVNGQITLKDVDRFKFHALSGERLVIELKARKLIPYIADAVPGWFQAYLTIYDTQNRQVVSADDYRNDPDPVILFKVPRDGDYIVEVRDAIYRGREDFVYRLSMGARPFIRELFPLGAREGTKAAATVSGWNLPVTQLALDTSPGAGFLRRTVSTPGEWPSNPVAYTVDDLPEALEKESNDKWQTAQAVPLPQTINGRIEAPGDKDVFFFEGRTDQEIVAEVYARRLDSPLDSLLRLTNAAGKVLAWNDDNEDKGTGLNTHHADSYIRFKLPKDGRYYIFLSDSQGKGGSEYAYRLRLGPSRPDFELRAVPSSFTAQSASPVPFQISILRRDGFNGPVEIALQDAPPGFTLSGGLIPAGRPGVRLTLTAPLKTTDELVQLKLTGQAVIGGRTVVRPVVPAEDMMQAFDYRHLVPVERLTASVVRSRRRLNAIDPAVCPPVAVPAGGSVRVSFKIPPGLPQPLSITLVRPPDGVSVADVSSGANEISFNVKAEAGKATPGLGDSLIAEVYQQAPATELLPARQVFLGYLPAIPLTITEK